MPLGFLFWLIMVIWFFVFPVNGLAAARQCHHTFSSCAAPCWMFVLFFILGWRAFGFVIQN